MFNAPSPIVKRRAVPDLAYEDSLAFDASDPNGDAITFSKDGIGADWLSIASDGALSGTPAPSDLGLHACVVRAEDTHGAATTATIHITISNAFFVRPGGSGDGSSWAGAATLEDAGTSAGVNTVICIAGGVYAIGDWHLDAQDGQTWLGAFPPSGSPGFDERDPDQHPTTFTAQMIPRANPIVRVNDRSDVAIDAIDFTQVHSTDPGGALEIVDSQAIVSRCAFTSNSAGDRYWDGGAGIRIGGSLPDVDVLGLRLRSQCGER